MEEQELIIGRNSVREAIRAGRSVEAIYVSARGEGSIREILALARKNGIIIKEVPKTKLDELSLPYGHQGNPGNHQGIAARVSEVAYQTVEDMFALAESRGQAPFLIMLDGIEDPFNLGAIVRSAEVMGAHGVILPKRRSASMTAAACKTACGAQEYLPIARVTNLAATIEEIKQRGVFVACADMDGQEAAKANLKGAMMLVIGAEGEGVSRLVKERSDFVVKIAVKGKIDSLNASAAAAVLMYEKVRQDMAQEV